MRATLTDVDDPVNLRRSAAGAALVVLLG